MFHATNQASSTLGLRCCIVISMALLANGCYTARALQIGERRERVTRFSGAFRHDDHLVVTLAAQVSSPHDPVVYEVSGWTAVDLGTVAWGPVRRPDAVPGWARQSLTMHAGPAPGTPAQPY